MGEAEPEKPTKRQNPGKAFFRLGLFALAVAPIIGALAAAGSARSYSPSVVADLGRLSGRALLVGLLVVLVGVLAWKLPRDIEGDALWVFKTGPFIRFMS